MVIGWWGIPLLITIITFLWLYINDIKDSHARYQYEFDIDGLLKWMLCIIVNLIVWLIYFILV